MSIYYSHSEYNDSLDFDVCSNISVLHEGMGR